MHLGNGHTVKNGVGTGFLHHCRIAANQDVVLAVLRSRGNDEAFAANNRLAQGQVVKSPNPLGQVGPQRRTTTGLRDRQVNKQLKFHRLTRCRDIATALVSTSSKDGASK